MQIFKSVRKNILEPVWNSFFPPVCFICNSIMKNPFPVVCQTCRDEMEYISFDETENYFEEIRIRNFDDVFIVFRFSEMFQKIVHLYKYENCTSLADYYAESISERYKTALLDNYDVIIPVPLHPVKLRERGYNQSWLIAQSLATQTGIEADHTILKRTKNTVSQAQLNREERRRNVGNAFHVCKKISGSRVLILDDVITTGSTINACCQELNKHGASRIGVIALATPISGVKGS